MVDQKLSQPIPLEYQLPTKHKPEELPKNKIISNCKGFKIGFVAGPYIGDGTYNVIENNIREAEIVAIELANRSIFFFARILTQGTFNSKQKHQNHFIKN